MCCAEESNSHASWYSHNGGIRDLEEKKCWIKLFLFLLHTKNILTALWNCGTTDATWTILSMEHSSCIAVYAGPESSRICALGTTLGRVINARIVIFGWTNPLKQTAINHSTFFHVHCILLYMQIRDPPLLWPSQRSCRKRKRSQVNSSSAMTFSPMQRKEICGNTSHIGEHVVTLITGLV